MYASVVACSDAAHVLEAAKHFLDLVSLAVEGLVVWDRGFATMDQSTGVSE